MNLKNRKLKVCSNFLLWLSKMIKNVVPHTVRQDSNWRAQLYHQSSQGLFGTTRCIDCVPHHGALCLLGHQEILKPCDILMSSGLLDYVDDNSDAYWWCTDGCPCYGQILGGGSGGSFFVKTGCSCLRRLYNTWNPSMDPKYSIRTFFPAVKVVGNTVVLLSNL